MSNQINISQAQVTGLEDRLTEIEGDIAVGGITDPQLLSVAGLTYTGNSLKVIRVNSGETGFELATPSGGGGTTTNAITFNNAGSGAASGATFDGSAAKTISYNSIGAQPLDATLTALAGASWSSGTQVLTLTAADTVALKTIGSSSGNILDKAAGDALYQPLDTQLTDLAGLSYSGNALKILRVNSGGTGLEFVSPSAGSGTVTDVSVVTANGISGSVATSTSTPAITLSLGAITPSSVAATGSVAAIGNLNVSSSSSSPSIRFDATGGTIGNVDIQFSLNRNNGNITILGSQSGGEMFLKPYTGALTVQKGDSSGTVLMTLDASGNLTATGKMVATSTVTPGSYTAAGRPSAATAGAGALYYQTDGTTGLYISNGSTWSQVGATASTDPLALGSSTVYSTTAPSTPSSGVNVVAVKRASMVRPGWVDTRGRFEQAQATLGQKEIMWHMANANASTFNTMGGVFTVSATSTNSTPKTNTDYYTTRRRVNLTGSTSSAFGEVYCSTQNLVRNTAGAGGYYVSFEFGLGSFDSAARLFCGTASGTGSFTGITEFRTLTNGFGIYKNSGDSSIALMANGTSTSYQTATLTNTGTLTGIASTWWRVEFYTHRTDTAIGYRVTRWSSTGTQTVDEGTMTGTAGTDMPSLTAMTCPHIVVQNTVATTISLLYGSTYVELD